MSSVAGAGGDRDDDGKKGPPSDESGKGGSKPTSKVHGKPGKQRCLIRHAMRGHVASNCPGNKCRRCGAPDHWARECPIAKCDWCGEMGHEMSKCPKGASKFLSTKRPAARSLDQAPGAKTMRPCSLDASNAGTCKKPFISKVGSFLDEVEADTLMDPEVVQQCRDMLARRCEIVETRYRDALADIERRRADALDKIDVDEEQLELELENESDFRKAIDQLANLKKKVLSGAKKRSLAKGNSSKPTGTIGSVSYAAATCGKAATVATGVSYAAAISGKPATVVANAMPVDVVPEHAIPVVNEEEGPVDSQSGTPGSNAQSHDLSRASPVKEDSDSEGSVQMLPRVPPSGDSGGGELVPASASTGSQGDIIEMMEDELLEGTEEEKEGVGTDEGKKVIVGTIGWVRL